MSSDGPTGSMAHVEVDCGRWLGALRRIWTSFGHDELNWASTPRGRRNLSAIRAFAEAPYTVRAHNLFTSGPGRGLPHWSSGNVYHEVPGADGATAAAYDWSIFDSVFDAWVEAGMRPIVELGFCPRALVPDAAEIAFTPMPSAYGPYEAGLWAWPPRDHRRWHDLVAATVRHACARYGAETVRQWYWELWNEPDIFYWKGTPEEYCALYDVTAAAVTGVLPEAAVGGPSTTGGGARFLDGFLAHCADGPNAATGGRGARLDFVSFHTKGASFRPWRTYGRLGPSGVERGERASPSTHKMLREIRENLAVAARHPGAAALPVLVDECDASVPAHWGVYDNPNFAYRNTEYYPVFQAQLMAKILDLDGLALPRVEAATTWSWYMEGDRFFEGTRSLFTAGDLPTPLLGAYRMLARLPARRLVVASDRARGLRALDEPDAPPEVDGLAATDGSARVAALVWHHCDDQYHAGLAAVEVAIRRLPFAGRPCMVRHFRIDRDHSNGHSAWVAAGRPQDPGPGQLAALQERAGLERFAPDEALEHAPADLTLRFDLPRPGLSLVEVEAM